MKILRRFRWLFLALLIAVLTLIALNRCFQFAVTEGSSMTPMIQNGEILLIRKIGGIHDGDIIAFYSERYDMILIKRVIAMEGETVSIHDGKIYRNGIMLIENYLQPGCYTSGDEHEITVLPDHLYVVGDNRPVSQDSRTAGVGTVSMEDVVGVAILRVWPLSSFQVF